MAASSPLSIFLLGIVVGGAAGYGLTLVTSDNGADAVPAEGLTTPSADHDADAPTVGLSTTGTGDAGHAEADPSPRLSPEAAEQLHNTLLSVLDGEQARGPVLGPLARLYVATRRFAEAYRVLNMGLTDGALAESEVLEILALMPLKARAIYLLQLLDAHSERAWEKPAQVSIHLVQVKQMDRAIAFLTPHWSASDDSDQETFINTLINADAAAALDALRGMAHRDLLTAGHLGQAAARLKSNGHEEGAHEMILLAIGKNPSAVGFLQRLAHYDAAGALGRAQALTVRNPAQAAAWQLVGKLLLKQGDRGEAYDAYLRAARINREDHNLLELLELDPTRALKDVAEITEEQVDDEAIGVLAKAHIANGDERAAYEVFRQAHDRDTTDIEWLLNMMRLDPRAATDLVGPRVIDNETRADEDVVGAYAAGLLRLGRSDEAFDYFEAAFKRDRTDTDWLYGMAQASPARAEAALRAHMEEADSSSWQQELALASALKRQGRTEEAIQRARSAFSSNRDGVHAFVYAQVDPVGARRMAQERVANNERDAEAWASLAYVELAAGNRTAASEAFREARLRGGRSWRWRMDERLPPE